MLLPGQIYIVWGPWHFKDFREVFLPNIGEEDQKKVSPFQRGTPC